MDCLFDRLKNNADLSKDVLNKLEKEINVIKKDYISINEFQNKMDEMKNKKINIVLKEIEIMPKYDLIQISEILIQITRLKRIITSERVTVDGKVLHYVLSLKDGIEKVYKVWSINNSTINHLKNYNPNLKV